MHVFVCLCFAHKTHTYNTQKFAHIHTSLIEYLHIQPFLRTSKARRNKRDMCIYVLVFTKMYLRNVFTKKHQTGINVFSKL